MEEEGGRTREEGGGGRTRVRVRLGFITAVELRTMCRMLAVFLQKAEYG